MSRTSASKLRIFEYSQLPTKVNIKLLVDVEFVEKKFQHSHEPISLMQALRNTSIERQMTVMAAFPTYSNEKISRIRELVKEYRWDIIDRHEDTPYRMVIVAKHFDAYVLSDPVNMIYFDKMLISLNKDILDSFTLIDSTRKLHGIDSDEDLNLARQIFPGYQYSYVELGGRYKILEEYFMKSSSDGWRVRKLLDLIWCYECSDLPIIDRLPDFIKDEKLIEEIRVGQETIRRIYEEDCENVDDFILRPVNEAKFSSIKIEL